MPAGELEHLQQGAWNPYFPEQIMTGSGRGILIFDTRAQKYSLSPSAGAISRTPRRVMEISHAHEQPVSALAVNPSNPYAFASGGQDCKLRLWDKRKADAGPVKTFVDHAHWCPSFSPVAIATAS